MQSPNQYSKSTPPVQVGVYGLPNLNSMNVALRIFTRSTEFFIVKTLVIIYVMPQLRDLQTYDASEWVENNKDKFCPPVCNKCMFEGQLLVFFIGGPNKRKDYHLEEGEEFFYQRNGSMCLKVVEKGKPKDVIINEGEVLMIPKRLLHSPQRYADTIGFVVERQRLPWEKDCLRYFVDESATEVLYERWTHVKDIVADLPPIIAGFFASEACKAGKPTSESTLEHPPFEPDPSAEVPPPIHLSKWLRSAFANSEETGECKVLYGPPRFTTEVLVYGCGSYNIDAFHGNTVLWHLENSAECFLSCGTNYSLHKDVMVYIPAQTQFRLKVEKEGFCLLLRMPPP